MEDQYIDISNTKKYYERTVARFLDDDRISSRNKDIMLRFLRDGALGKTVIGRAKKKISAARLAGYINQLYHIILFLKKDLDKIEMVDMEAFIEALETNRIPSRKVRYQGNKRVTLDHVDNLKSLHEKLQRSLLRSECYVGSDLLKLVSYNPRIYAAQFKVRDNLKNKLLKIEIERRKLTLTMDHDLRNMMDRLFNLLVKHDQLVRKNGRTQSRKKT